MKKKSKIIGIVAIAIAIVLVLFLVVRYIQYQRQISKNEELMNQLAEETESEIEVTVLPTDQTESVSENQTIEKKHDFKVLKQTNEDIYAWIIVPDTQVDYPILQSSTDNKYLDTNIDGSKGYPGCIYTNSCNSKNFDDYITVVYGHNMKSGEMFGSLHNFDEEDFFDSFETYTVETETSCLTYSVYAAVNYNDKLIPAYYDVKSASGRDEFIASLEECRGNSLTHFNDDITISGEDKVLVLSVCIGGQDTRRYLIVSKLEKVATF